jgi:hypothetical protein
VNILLDAVDVVKESQLDDVQKIRSVFDRALLNSTWDTFGIPRTCCEGLRPMKVTTRAYFHFLLPVMLVCCCEKSMWGQADSSDQMRYQVVYDDDRTIEGAAIEKDHFFAHGRSDAHLDGQPIFLPDNQVRLIRNRRTVISTVGTYIEFMNGDILPGQVVGIGVARPGRNMPDYLRVRLSPPLTNHTGKNASLINVQAERVARVVTRTPAGGSGKPGSIRLKSGPYFEFKAMRWQADKILTLTSDGDRTIPIQDVAELHQSIGERMRLMMSGRTEIGFDSPGHQVVFQAINGARLTTREERMVRSKNSRTIIQPSWALDSIMLAPEDIAEVLFLRQNEFPLASLPAETLATKNVFGKWNWTRNRNVRGGRLDSGDRDSPIGVGMSAYTAVAFHLPAGAESFTSWVGLDRAAGDGGCAVASVHLNDLKSEPAWRSGFLQGGKSSVSVGPLSVKNQQRLVLVADYGHKGRPQGADPFDIRDEVNWINSIVEVKPPASAHPELQELFPFLTEWTMSQEDRARLRPVQAWNSNEGRWVYTLKLPSTASADQTQPTVFNTPGVHYEYFEDYREAVLPDFDKMKPTGSGTSPSIFLAIPNLKTNYIAIRFNSTLVVTRDGIYEFFLKSDDGSKLYVNDELVIANDGQHGPIEKQGRVALKKGGVPIKVEYFNSAGPQHLDLVWKGPGRPRKTIGSESFDLSETPPVADLNLSGDYTALEPITLNRTLSAKSPNAWLSLYAGKNNEGIGDYEIEVRVDGSIIPAIAAKQIDTKQLQPMQTTGGVWRLGNRAGQTINIQIQIKPSGYPGIEMPALYLSQLETGPDSRRLVDRSIDKDLLGRWRLRGARSNMKKSYYTG